MKTGSLLALTGWLALSAGEDPARLFSREVHLMGTRAVLSVQADSRASGLAVLDTALTALEQAEAELSTWRPSSAISILNRQPVGQPWTATPRLCHMFSEVWAWRRATDGAFDPTIGRLLAAWDVHGDGRHPSAIEWADALAASGTERLAFDAGRCTMTRLADATIDVGAFGKGEALDRAAAMLQSQPWMIDLGGQVSVGGPTRAQDSWRVAIADPRRRDRPVIEVPLTSGSLSTSAGSERDLVVNGSRVGHILDPRTGRPAEFEGSVSVWHERGLAADALSTALYVMGPDDGLRWAAARDVAALYLIPDGATLRIESSPAFGRLRARNVTEPE